MKKLFYAVLTVIAYFLGTTLNVSANNVGSMMRYYNTSKGTYLFTVNAAEIEKLKTFSYLQPQGAVFNTANSGTKLYRFYHQKTGRYVFTGKQSEIAKMTQNGWVYEGFAFYSGGNVPIYRLYDYATGQHFYTGKKSEVDAFVLKGWVNEGVGFYADSLPTVTEIKTEKRTVITPFTKISRLSEDVPKGQTEVITPGVNGETEETYQVIYVNGVKKSEVKTSSRVLKTLVTQVEAIGTGFPTYVIGYDWETGKRIGEKETNTARDTIAEVKRSLPDNEYVLYLRNYERGHITPLYSPEEMREIFKTYFNVQKFNEEFAKLINAHRKNHSLEPLKLADVAIKAAMIRSNEQAEIAFLRSYGKPHTRPDGTSWSTVSNDIPEYASSLLSFRGENILARSEIELNYLIDEKYLANKAFTQWQNSSGHNAAMLSTSYTHFGVGAGFLTTKMLATTDLRYPFPIIATTIFARK